MSLPAREQIKLLFDLLKAKVKFKSRGGQKVKCEDGRLFYKGHYDAAKAVIKIQRDKRRNPYGTRDSEEVVAGSSPVLPVDSPSGMDSSSTLSPSEASGPSPSGP